MGRKYDTLDDVDTSGAATIADVYALVLGEAMRAEDLCGVVITGALNLSHSPAGYWGRYTLDFRGHPEVWYVRCAPPGRCGLPLEPNEVRQVSVLVRESKTFPLDEYARPTFRPSALWYHEEGPHDAHIP